MQVKTQVDLESPSFMSYWRSSLSIVGSTKSGAARLACVQTTRQAHICPEEATLKWPDKPLISNSNLVVEMVDSGSGEPADSPALAFLLLNTNLFKTMASHVNSTLDEFFTTTRRDLEHQLQELVNAVVDRLFEFINHALRVMQATMLAALRAEEQLVIVNIQPLEQSQQQGDETALEANRKIGQLPTASISQSTSPPPKRIRKRYRRVRCNIDHSETDIDDLYDEDYVPKRLKTHLAIRDSTTDSG